MAVNKMFVNFKGTKAQFEEVKAQYPNQIVFINEGKMIFAKGAYYGSIDETIAGLKYFTSVKVGDQVASSPDNKGVITFAADATVALNVDTKGITIGLSQATKDAIAAAAVKSEVDAEIAEINEAIAALEAFETRIKGNEDNIAAIQDELNSLSGGAGSVQTQINNAISALDLPNTYEAKGAAAQALIDAKAYADSLVYDDTALAGRVETVEGAIELLNGEGDGSVKKSVADAIAGVVASAPEDFDTLKEIADYIASDKTGAAEINNAISANATAIAAEKSRAELAESGLETAIISAKNEINAIIIENERVIAEALTDLNTRTSELSSATYTKEEVDAMWEWEEA